ncbi:hypothetical protein KSS87_022838, partial [Heliosperma pusillum]
IYLRLCCLERRCCDSSLQGEQSLLFGLLIWGFLEMEYTTIKKKSLRMR